MDTPDLVVIVPTRARPTNALRLLGALFETCVMDTRPVLVVADDDPCLDTYMTMPGPRPRIFTAPSAAADWPAGVVAPLNYGAAAAAREFRPSALAFMGDDHLPLTHGWDQIFLDKLLGMGGGFVYGDDRIQGGNLATAVAMSIDAYRTLGYFAVPTLTHLYCDNAWTDLANATLGEYLPDVVIEHLHHTAGAAPYDETYRPGLYEGAAAEAATAQYLAYNAWKQDRMPGDVDKLRRLWGLH